MERYLNLKSFEFITISDINISNTNFECRKDGDGQFNISIALNQ
jgi:hypothetical protein